MGCGVWHDGDVLCPCCWLGRSPAGGSDPELPQRRVAVVKALLDAGADPNGTCALVHGRTALMRSCFPGAGADPLGCKAVRAALLGAGAEPTGNVTITCIEFYATKEGLDEHFKLFHAGDWKGGEEFGALMGTGKVSFAGAGYGETLVSVANDEFALE